MQNVVPFPVSPRQIPHEPRTPYEQAAVKAEREILCALIEEHLTNVERAVRSAPRLRELLEEWKALEGWTWKHPASL